MQETSDFVQTELIGPGQENPQFTCGVVVDGELSCAGAYPALQTNHGLCLHSLACWPCNARRVVQLRKGAFLA